MATKSKKSARAVKTAKATRALRGPKFGGNPKAAPSIAGLRTGAKGKALKALQERVASAGGDT